MIGKSKLTRSRQGVTRSQALIGDNLKFRGFHRVPNITNQTMDQPEPIPCPKIVTNVLLLSIKENQPNPVSLDLLSHQVEKGEFLHRPRILQEMVDSKLLPLK